jgi:hypothetical protein
MYSAQLKRIYTRFLWFAAAAYSTSASYYGFYLVIHALHILCRENSSFICLFLLLLDIIDFYNLDQIYFEENRPFFVLMGTWIIRTKYYYIWFYLINLAQ